MQGLVQGGLVLITLAAAAPVMAQGLRDAMFSTERSCYARRYSKSHLAEHPAQRVTKIALTPDIGTSDDPDLRLILLVKIKTSDEILEAISYCDPAGADRMFCSLEGDAGGFTVAPARNGSVLLTVGTLGIGLEGAQGFVMLEHDRGDDRSFILPAVEGCE